MSVRLSNSLEALDSVRFVYNPESSITLSLCEFLFSADYSNDFPVCPLNCLEIVSSCRFSISETVASNISPLRLVVTCSKLEFAASLLQRDVVIS